MRIVVLGDFHLPADGNRDKSVLAMEDVQHCAPDLVIPLGDFGKSSDIGFVRGLEQAFELLRTIDVPLRPILGNHDLQRESGPERQQAGTMKDACERLFQGDASGGFLEFDSFRLAFASTEPQPAESCYQIQECFVSDEQFTRLVDGLQRRKGVPVIFFTHAPPLGCGLRTWPRTHVRATNAYLDHNHNPYRWLDLVRDYPEIIMWFSAHYHLGHEYVDSHTVRYGTHFFLTGVHGDCTRDGLRQSRVVEIDEADVSVGTLDHVRRELVREGEWRANQTIAELMQSKLFRLEAGCRVSEASLQSHSLLALPGERFVAASEDGYSWEIHPRVEAVMGTLHVNCQVNALASTGDRIWSAWESFVGVSPMDQLSRFVRAIRGGAPERSRQVGTPVRCLTAHDEDSVWAADDRALWIAKWEEDEEDGGGGQLQLYDQCSLEAPPRAITGDSSCCWIVTVNDQLYRWDGRELRRFPLPERVLALDALDGQVTVLLFDGHRYTISEWQADGNAGFKQLQMLEGGREPDEDGASAQIIRLRSGRETVVLRLGESAYYWPGDGWPCLRFNSGVTAVSAISRVISDAPRPDCLQFALTGQSDDGSRLELWSMRLS